MGEMAPAPPRTSTGSGGGGVAAAFGVAAVSMLALLLARNARVFTAAVHERGDFAANSIITTDAKHFELLVGNYSRIGFSHPGPAFFYVQAFGEWLFHDLLHAVPAPWNGQWLALLVLNAALLGLTLAVVHSWSRSWRTTALCGAAALTFFAVQPGLLASAWMPYLYVAPFLLLLTAAASVAAGRAAHLPVLALAGGLLVHGHAGFLFFVPPVVGLALVAMWRRGTRPTRREWGAAGAVAAVFALPMVLNLVLHWPGEFPRYFGYGGRRGLHGPGEVAGYLLRFWAERPALAVPLFVALFGGVALLRRRDRFLAAGLAAAVVGTLLFAGYAMRGIDHLDQLYVGHFSRAIPLLLLLLLVLGLASQRRPHPFLVLALLVGALGVAGRSPSLTSNPEHLPELPRVMDVLRGQTGGRPVVVDLDHAAWPALTALVAHGERAGQRVCARDPKWRFLVTAQFVCTAHDEADGVPVHLGPTPTGPVLAELDGMVLSS
ncbi:hypothetical protein WEI85_30675 [Actinomycetes bacterium KLBMP 9797]